jgi:hypothetical protein
MTTPLSPLFSTRGPSRAAVLCLWAVLLICSSSAADDAQVELQGILPDYIPNGLTEGDFAQLGVNWSAWAARTGRLVTDFYTSEDTAVRGRRATLEQIQLRLSTMESALNDQRYLSIYGPLADLYGRLSRRVAISAALLETIDQSDSPELRELAAQLLQAIDAYESDATSETMEEVRNSFDDLRRHCGDRAAALTEAMRLHFLNYNLRVVMDESLLQDIIHDTRMESGYINEMVSGAQITGCQWTNTTVTLDLKPSDTGVRFELILNGTVRSSAQGETQMATVYARGRHCFTSRKLIHFDGDRFQHWRAAVGAGGASSPYAAETCLSWAPLLGGASERLVLKIADNKASDANADTLKKIRREVSSQFDRETGNMLSQAELSLEEKVAGPLRKRGYYPQSKSFQSTETEMEMRTRTMEADELGGGAVLPLPINPAHGVLVQVHESLLNQIGNRLQLDGKRLTPDELKEHLRTELQAITGKEVDLSDVIDEAGRPGSPKVEQIIFHESDAVRSQIRGGEVVLILRIGLKLEDREDLPPQRISVPLKFALEGGKFVMQRGTVGVGPIGPVAPRERGQQIARAGIIRSKIQEAFEPREFANLFTVDAGEKQVTLKVTDLRARSGWLSVIATDGISQSQSPEGDSIEPTPQPLPQTADGRQTLTR